jgi:hypothetical protein
MPRLRLILYGFLLLLPCASFAQLGKNMESNILYEREWEGGVFIHTNGYGLLLRRAAYINVNTYHLWDVDLYILKHPKEISLSNPDNPDSQPFVFGKTNAFAILRVGYGMRHILADVANNAHIRIDLNYSIGPDIGFLKPVYYEITEPGADANPVYEKFNPTDEKQNNRNSLHSKRNR